MADPRDPRITTTKGEPLREGEPSAAPEPIDPETGQHGAYWILTEEERAKGFVRPVRMKYVHAGMRPKHPTRPLTDEQKARYDGLGYVEYEPYPESESPMTGKFWTQVRLNSGCGAVTTMRQDLAETYARQPTFYGETFCSHCGDHFVVGEFLWDGTDEVVGS